MADQGDKPGTTPEKNDDQDLQDLDVDDEEGLTERVRGGRRRTITPT